MILPLCLLSPAVAATFEWADPTTDAEPNAALGDLDGDGRDDLVIGVPDRCGHLEIWLAADDPALGQPDDPRQTCLNTPTYTVRAAECHEMFGREVAFGFDARRRPVLGTLRTTDDNAVVTLRMSGDTLVVNTDPSQSAGDCQCSEPCEPCSGPAPCCNTGSGGSGGGGGPGSGPGKVEYTWKVEEGES